MNAKTILTSVIGVGAFVIGGLLARQSALEGIDLLEEKVNDRFNKPDPTEVPAE